MQKNSFQTWQPDQVTASNKQPMNEQSINQPPSIGARPDQQSGIDEKTILPIHPGEAAAFSGTPDEKTISLSHPEPQNAGSAPDEKTMPLPPLEPQAAENNADIKQPGQFQPVKPEVLSGPRVLRQYRDRGFPLALAIPLITLAGLLILASFALLLYGSTFQYKHALRAQATADTQATVDIQTTATAQAQATANILATVQTQIDATSTAQAGLQASATAVNDQATMTASQKASQYTQAATGTPTLDDSLNDNTGKGKWDTGTASVGTGCHFLNGSYEVTVAQRGYLQPCLARATNFKNFAYQVQMTIAGGSQGGLLFDANADTNSYYFFRAGTDGTYALDLYQGGNQAQTLTTGINTSITTGLNQPNTLAVLVQDGTINLYVNQTFITSVDNTALSSGQVGVAAINYNTPTRVTFTSSQAWNK